MLALGKSQEAVRAALAENAQLGERVRELQEAAEVAAGARRDDRAAAESMATRLRTLKSELLRKVPL